MKKIKTLLVLVFAMSLSLVNAQEYHFTEGFAENADPEGWTTKDVSYSSSATNAANKIDTASQYCAKMKTNNDNTSWLQTPLIFGVEDMSFYCKVKDISINPSLTIQSSTDGVTWFDEVTNPSAIDFTNVDSFQYVEVQLLIEGLTYIRFYVTSDEAGKSSTGTFTLDDIRIGKPSVPEDNADLDMIYVNDGSMSSVPDVMDYTVKLFYVPEVYVDGTAVDSSATVAVTQASDIFGDTEAERTAKISIKSKDESVTKDYSILLNVNKDTAWFENFGETDFVAIPYVSTGYIGSVPSNGNTLPEQVSKMISFNDSSRYVQTPSVYNAKTLVFNSAMRKNENNEEFDLMVYQFSANDDNDSTLLETISFRSSGLTTDSWKQFSIDAISDTGAVYFKFWTNMLTGFSSRMAIDDILILAGETSSAISSVSNDINVNVSPNPAQDVLMVSGVSGHFAVSLYNLNGALVMSSANTNKIDISSVSAGSYLVKVQNELGSSVQKLIIK